MCIQKMMNQGEIHIARRLDGKEIAMLEIPYPDIRLKIPITPATPLIICSPAPFPYENAKAILWKYNPTIYKEGQEDKPLMINEPSIMNVAVLEKCWRLSQRKRGNKFKSGAKFPKRNLSHEGR